MTADQPLMLLLPSLFYLISFCVFKFDDSIKLLRSLDDEDDIVLATVICAGLSIMIR
jgi:hypothetical protein